MEKWNDALKSSKQIITNSGHICKNHFNQNDLQGTGIRTRLKELAVPFFPYVSTEDAELGLEKNQLEEANQKIDELRKEIDEKNRHIQNLSEDLNEFQKNSLAQFAVNAQKDSTV